MTVALDEAVRDLSAAERTAFVADVWAASGWETAVDGRHVTATRGESTQKLLWYEDAREESEDAKEEPVDPREDDDGARTGDLDTDGARLLDAGDLFERLAYAVPDDERASLLERHVGVSSVDPPEHLDRDAGREVTGAATPTVSAPAVERRPGAISPGSGTGATERGRGSGDGFPNGESEEGSEESEEGSEESAEDPRNGESGSEPTGAVPVRRRGVVLAVVVLFVGAGVVGVADVGDGAAAPEPATGTSLAERAEMRTVPNDTTYRPVGDAERRYVAQEPTCERAPGTVVYVQVGALRTADPQRGDGIRTVWGFASRSLKARTTYDAFAERLRAPEYRPLFDHVEAAYAPVETERTSARQRVTVTTPNGTTATYEWRLSRQGGGRLDGCWMIDGISRE